MLRLIKKHRAACTRTSEKDWKCKAKNGGKVACPFYIVGPHPTNPLAPRVKKNTGTSAEQNARGVLFEFERSLFNPLSEQPNEKPKPTLDEALELFLLTKKHKSADRKRTLRRQHTQMIKFLKEIFNREYVVNVLTTDLEKFMFSWDGRYSTLQTRRENLKGFWKYCFDHDFTTKNIATPLPVIGDQREDKERRAPTFSLDEITKILTACGCCQKLFRREGENIARQIKAFTYIERYTGMAIGDVAKLRKDEVDGNRIICNRKKTGEAVWTIVPPFVIDALKAMASDSPEYYFWSGQGELHTRTSKWGTRLQKLYVFAGVRVTEVVKRTRSGGKLKPETELVNVSSVTPHYWRHTFVRDHYLIGTSVEEIAELIGDDAETVRKHYSCFDHLRQKKLWDRQQRFWLHDALAEQIMSL